MVKSYVICHWNSGWSPELPFLTASWFFVGFLIYRCLYQWTAMINSSGLFSTCCVPGTLYMALYKPQNNPTCDNMFSFTNPEKGSNLWVVQMKRHWTGFLCLLFVSRDHILTLMSFHRAAEKPTNFKYRSAKSTTVIHVVTVA